LNPCTREHVNQLIDAETTDLSLQQVANPWLCLAKEISRLGLRPAAGSNVSRKSIIKSALILRFAASSVKPRSSNTLSLPLVSCISALWLCLAIVLTVL
jgi:hypothetical protein